ncbi:MAG: response regulator [Candidatus Ancaeobacter aquaticus]|nr:response regulator [Candidatus Ancaeobacter aquaticus]
MRKDAFKILVVDDDPGITSLFEHTLRKKGFTVSSANSVTQGFDEYTKVSPHLIFLDIELGNESGLELLKKIRETDSKTIIIIVTAHGSTDTNLGEIQYHAYGELQKPIKPEQLEDIVVNAIETNYDMLFSEDSILVIDDEEAITTLLEDILSSEGFSVSTAKNGEKGIALAKKNAFDIIIVDIMMPGIDGFETIKRIREFDTGAHIMILSAYGKKDDVLAQTEQYNIKDFISKPFDIDKLMLKLRTNGRL